MKTFLMMLSVLAFVACNHPKNADELARETTEHENAIRQQTIDSMETVNREAKHHNANSSSSTTRNNTSNASSSKSHNNTSNASSSTTRNNTSNDNASTNTASKKKGMSNKTKGALIGTGAGIIGGAVTGAAVSKNKGKGAIIGGLIGGAIGSGVGYGIGAKKDKKDTIK